MVFAGLLVQEWYDLLVYYRGESHMMYSVHSGAGYGTYRFTAEEGESPCRKETN